MVNTVWDYVNEVFRRLRGDASGRAVTLPEGQYLETPPTLDDEDYHHLTLTSDAKLRVDDPTTQAAIADVEAKIDIAQADLDNPDQYKADVTNLDVAVSTRQSEADALTRYNALDALIDAVEAKLDVPDNYKADVSALALEATLDTHNTALGTHDTDIKGLLTTVQADLDNPAQYKADVSALALEDTVEAVATALEGHHLDITALLENAAYGLSALKTLIDAVEGKLDVPDNYKADVSALALEATLTAIKGAGWTDETLKAIKDAIDAAPGGATAQQVWEYATRRLTNLSDARAAKIDNLDAAVSSRLAAASYETERGTDNAALASVCTEARLARLDVAVSSRSSHDDPDPSGYIDHSIADLITRAKGLNAIYDKIPTDGGGVDWSALTPEIDSASTNSTSDTDVINISGTGYLLSVSQMISAITGSVVSKGSVRVYLDGALLYSGYYSAEGDYSDTNGINGLVIAGPLRFNTSLRIRHKVSNDDISIRTMVSYVLE